jgi:hypothetical protein
VGLWFANECIYIAEVMKLVDVPDSKSGEGNLVGVRFPLSAPTNRLPTT